MFTDIINRVLAAHPDFTHEDVEIFCRDFIAGITEKIKEETKIKRLVKYMEKEFELSGIASPKKDVGIYSLDTLPEYLMTGKPEITSSLVTIS